MMDNELELRIFGSIQKLNTQMEICNKRLDELESMKNIVQKTANLDERVKLLEDKIGACPFCTRMEPMEDLGRNRWMLLKDTDGYWLSVYGYTQHVIKVHFCPMCGRKLTEGE